MTNLENGKPLTGGEQKVEEYVQRIKSGESKDSIFQDLPESFKTSIENKLKETTEEKSGYGINDIPPQYQGLDSDTLDFIWTFPEYLDPEKTKEMKEKKKTYLQHCEKKNPVRQKN